MAEENKPLESADTQNKLEAKDDIESSNTQANEQETFSKVAVAPAKRNMMLGLFLALSCGVIYYYYNRPDLDSDKKKMQIQLEQKKKALEAAATPVTEVNTQHETQTKSVTPVAPQKLEDPKAPEPPPPPLPVAPPTLVNTNSGTIGIAPRPGVVPSSTSGGSSIGGGVLKVTSKKEEDHQKRINERRKSGIMVLGGGALQGSSNSSGQAQSSDNRSADNQEKKPEQTSSARSDSSGYLGFGNGAFGEQSLAKTQTEQVKATAVGDLDYIVLQGKTIEAVLETGIDTDLPGTLRAIIARDIYAESGRNVLIKAGSKVIGTYASEVKDGQTRVVVNWQRLILSQDGSSDGVDIQIGSPGTDELGRSGVMGDVDSKFWTRMGTAFMVSYLVPTIVNKVSGVSKQQVTAAAGTGSGSGSSTGGASTNNTVPVSGSVEALQAGQSAKDFGDIMKKSVESSLNTKPTIRVDQGTKVMILVNKDLVIPKAALSKFKVSNKTFGG